MPLTEPILLQKSDGPPWDLEAYRRLGGYEAWGKCVKGLSSVDIVNELKQSGLRGRGGAGFPTGTKWDKVLNHRIKERYFVCNAGEHEPGTFKDRYLVKHYPHQLLEGCLIAAYTVKAKASFIYVNHEFEEERASLTKAMEQARRHGLLELIDDVLGAQPLDTLPPGLVTAETPVGIEVPWRTVELL